MAFSPWCSLNIRWTFGYVGFKVGLHRLAYRWHLHIDLRFLVVRLYPALRGCYIFENGEFKWATWSPSLQDRSTPSSIATLTKVTFTATITAMSWVCQLTYALLILFFNFDQCLLKLSWKGVFDLDLTLLDLTLGVFTEVFYLNPHVFDYLEVLVC